MRSASGSRGGAVSSYASSSCQCLLFERLEVWVPGKQFIRPYLCGLDGQRSPPPPRRLDHKRDAATRCIYWFYVQRYTEDSSVGTGEIVKMD